MLRERGIEEEWIGRTLASPEANEPDRRHPERRCALRRIPEFGDRWLRVVYVEDEKGGEATMRLSYDGEIDALFVRFAEEVIVESEEVRPGLVIDFDAAGRIVAIEVLDAREQLTPQALADLKAA